jgi:hypothetical protein
MPHRSERSRPQSLIARAKILDLNNRRREEATMTGAVFQPELIDEVRFGRSGGSASRG